MRNVYCLWCPSLCVDAKKTFRIHLLTCLPACLLPSPFVSRIPHSLTRSLDHPIPHSLVADISSTFTLCFVRADELKAQDSETARSAGVREPTLPYQYYICWGSVFTKRARYVKGTRFFLILFHSAVAHHTWSYSVHVRSYHTSRIHMAMPNIPSIIWIAIPSSSRHRRRNHNSFLVREVVALVNGTSFFQHLPLIPRILPSTLARYHSQNNACFLFSSFSFSINPPEVLTAS